MHIVRMNEDVIDSSGNYRYTYRPEQSTYEYECLFTKVSMVFECRQYNWSDLIEELHVRALHKTRKFIKILVYEPQAYIMTLDDFCIRASLCTIDYGFMLKAEYEKQLAMPALTLPDDI